MGSPPWFPVNAAELSRRLAELGPDAFPRLVNALLAAWSATQGPGISLRLNELAHLPDGGIDALAQLPEPVGELPAGRVVFQFKWRDIRRKAEKELWQDLGRRVDSEIRRLVEGQAGVPQAYVLVTNLRLGEREQREFLESRRQLLADLHGSSFRLWEAGRLFAELRAYPHVAYWILGGPSFMSLDDADEAMRRRAALLGLPYPEIFVGRDDEIEAIRAHLSREPATVVVLTGPPGIGASRLMLEALRPFAARSVWVGGAAPSPEDLALLSGPGTILAIDQPEDLLSVARLAASPARPSLVVAATGVRIPPELESLTIALAPLSREDVERLVEKLAPPSGRPSRPLDFLERSWVSHHAQGVPGLAAALATTAAERGRWDESAPAKAWLERLIERLSDDEQRTLKFVAALGPIGAREDRAQELRNAMAAFGEAPPDLGAILDRLHRSGLIVYRGRLAEIPMGLLAAALAERWMEDHGDRVARVLLGLDDGLNRLVRLIARAGGSAVTQCLARDALRSWFSRPDDLAKRAEEFRLLAAAVPEAALRYLERLWNDKGEAILRPRPHTAHRPQVTWLPDERLGHLQEIAWFLEGLVFRGIDVHESSTRLEALELLGALAAAALEDERSAPFAEAFAEAMVPHHPEVDIPLPDRLSLLRRLAESARPAERRVAAAALRRIFAARARFTFRYRSGSSRRAVGAASFTLDEIASYLGGLVELAAPLLKDDVVPAHVRVELARDAIGLHASAPFADQDAVERLVHAAEEAFPIAPTTVAGRKEVASALEVARRGAPEELQDLLQQLRADLEPRKRPSFGERLAWLASELTWSQEEAAFRKNKAAPDEVFKTLQRMACRAAREPELLDEKLAFWVLEKAPLGHLFAAKMGEEEARRGAEPSLIRHLAPRSSSGRAHDVEGGRGWIWYLAFWARFAGAPERIAGLAEQLINRGALRLAAEMTFSVAPGRQAFETMWSPIMAGLASAGEPERAGVVHALQFSTWSRELPAADLAELLRDLLEAGVPPLEVVKVTWARKHPLERPLTELVLDAVERWTRSMDDARRLEDLVHVMEPLRAAAAEFSERYEAWLLDTLKRTLELERYGLPMGAHGVVRQLLEHLGDGAPSFKERLLLLIARGVQAAAGVLGAVSTFAEPLIDPLSESDRDLLARLARDDPEAVAVILDQVLEPPGRVLTAAAARTGERSPEAVVEEREEAFLGLLMGAARASDWHPEVRAAVERSLHRLGLSSWTEPLAQRALERLRQWERSEEADLRAWASRYRPKFERELQRQMRWDAETLLWDSRLTHDDARRILERDPDDPQRRWLVRRILSDVPFSEAQLLLAPEDVERGLEEAERLSPATRRKWEMWLRERARVP